MHWGPWHGRVGKEELHYLLLCHAVVPGWLTGCSRGCISTAVPHRPAKNRNGLEINVFSYENLCRKIKLEDNWSDVQIWQACLDRTDWCITLLHCQSLWLSLWCYVWCHAELEQVAKHPFRYRIPREFRQGIVLWTILYWLDIVLDKIWPGSSLR